MRILIRALALAAPVVAVALMAAAAQGGTHVSHAAMFGFPGAVFLASWGVLQVTRKKAAPQRRPAADFRFVPAARRGRR